MGRLEDANRFFSPFYLVFKVKRTKKQTNKQKEIKRARETKRVRFQVYKP